MILAAAVIKAFGQGTAQPSLQAECLRRSGSARRGLAASTFFIGANSGQGFGPLAAAVHELGLKLGMHMMRGIPRIAVDKNLPVYGTNYTAKDVADLDHVCKWNPDNYGLNQSHPGAQAWYDAQLDLFASWGLDFLKVDDMQTPFHSDEIAAYHRAIAKAEAKYGRSIDLSLSPGGWVATSYVDFLRDMYRLHEKKSPAHAGKKGAKPDAGFKGFLDSQLTWDRAMAEALSLEVSQDGRKNPTLVVGIMGSGHIRFGHGVPHQLGYLGVAKVASLLPVALDGECRHLESSLATAVFTLPNKAMPPSEPPRLGVALEDTARGLTISAVTPGSLAEKTGLRAGDRIIDMAGRPASGSSEAVATIRRQPPGTWLPLRVARGDSQLDLVVQFPPRP